MAANREPIFGLTPICEPVTLVNADGTTKKTIYTPGADGGKLEAIEVTSDDTSTVDLQVWFTVGGTDYLVSTTQIPVTAGFVPGTVPVDIFDSARVPAVDANGAWIIPSTAAVKVSAKVAVTAAKTVYVVPRAIDF